MGCFSSKLLTKGEPSPGEESQDQKGTAGAVPGPGAATATGVATETVSGGEHGAVPGVSGSGRVGDPIDIGTMMKDLNEEEEEVANEFDALLNAEGDGDGEGEAADLEQSIFDPALIEGVERDLKMEQEGEEEAGDVLFDPELIDSLEEELKGHTSQDWPRTVPQDSENPTSTATPTLTPAPSASASGTGSPSKSAPETTGFEASAEGQHGGQGGASASSENAAVGEGLAGKVGSSPDPASASASGSSALLPGGAPEGGLGGGVVLSEATVMTSQEHEDAYSILRQAAIGLPSIEEEDGVRLMVKGVGVAVGSGLSEMNPGLQATAISA